MEMELIMAPFDKLFRTTCAAVVFAVAFTFAQPDPDYAQARAGLFSTSSVQNADAKGDNVKKIDPKTRELPFIGLSTKSPEEVVKELEGKTPSELLDSAKNLVAERLHADARVIYKSLIRPDVDENDLFDALNGLRKFGRRHNESDIAFLEENRDLVERALQVRPDSWRIRQIALVIWGDLPEQGRMVDGKFAPTYDWDPANLSQKDRVRVRQFQLYVESLPLLREEVKQIREKLVADDNKGASNQNGESDNLYNATRLREIDQFYDAFVAFIAESPNMAWRLQVLTDYSTLPDYTPSDWDQNRSRFSGAPVDENGDPIFYASPESFETAKNDGERRQALLDEILKNDESEYARALVLNRRANEAYNLYGVHTLKQFQSFLDSDLAQNKEKQKGILTLDTLAENETIAKLAGGVKRFTLPENYDYINMWREIAELKSNDRGDAPEAMRKLAREFENRRQLDKALDVWQNLLSYLTDKEKVRDNERRIVEAKNAISQIVDPRVRVENSSIVKGSNAKLDLRFRNANNVEIVAKRLNIDAALKEIRSAEFWKVNRYESVSGLVARILQEEFRSEQEDAANKSLLKKILGSKKFVGEEVARFKIDLTSDQNHGDKLTSVDLPFHETGAYLVEVAADGGENKDAVVVWLRNVAFVKKNYEQGARVFVFDARTGAPIANQNVEIFVVKRSWRRDKQEVETREIKKTTDQNGSILLENESISNDGNEQALFVVPAKGKDKAAQYDFLDFRGLYRVNCGDEAYAQTRAFFISDRPIYRPKQKAEFKFIVGEARYDAPEKSAFANRKLVYRVMDPLWQKVVQKSVTLDANGSFADSFELPEDSKLGCYTVQLAENFKEDGSIIMFLGDGTFRIEEYRKPEFKVTVDAPKDPVALGDSFKATVNAKYYFGAPVVNATVSYKVTRKSSYSTYFPPRYWDWFYGCGYWQFAYEATWYPGWRTWGCMCVNPSIKSSSRGVPEVVAEGEAEIGADGTFDITVDSALAKELYPNDDQEYEISVEVTDESRRTIVGNGKVYAARKPFQTYVWFDRGFFRVGDKMTAGFQARRLDGKPVVGNAVVKLYKVTYNPTDDRSVEPVEKEVFAQELKTNEEGKGFVEMTAAEPGQYRLSCVVSTESGISQEGGQLIFVRGTEKKELGKVDYRFNKLEIIPDKPEYSVGDVAHLQIASDNPDAYVLITTRPKGSVATGEPCFLKLEHGIAYFDVAIGQGDQPNIFVQASTVYNGELIQEQKELAVPPEKRVLDVAIEPVKDKVKPGEKVSVKLRLTDVDGKPVVGHTAVTVYDKSLEDVAGGSNIGDMREFFWKWRRSAFTNVESNLDGGGLAFAYNWVYDSSRQRLIPIGAFGSESMMSGQAMGISNGMGAPRLGGRVLKRATRARMADDREAMDAVAEEVEFEIADAAPVALAAAPAPLLAKGAANDLDVSLDATVATEEAASSESDPASQSQFIEATVRKNLADLAFWAADLTPGDDGVIEIEVDAPENLTTWKIAAWSVGDGLRVGSGEAEFITSKDLIIRMQKPRFLTQKDEVTLSANVHNYLDTEKKVRVSLEFPTDDPEKSTAKLSLADGSDSTRELVVPADGETRVDWTVRADLPGVATLLMKALTDEESDAMQDTITVKEHGVEKQIAVSGVVPPADKNAKDQDAQKVRESTFSFVVPEERRKETSKLTVRFSPSLAGAIFDAVPYLAQYPYGCTEQTLNKFLPLVVAQKALQEAGVDLAKLQEKKVNLNAQELGDAKERAGQWKGRNRLNDPIFSIDEVRKMTAQGVAKLASMQNSDGGWGWFAGDGSVSSANITALVASGLAQAQKCDQAIEDSVLNNAKEWLANYEREQIVRIIRGKVWTDEKKTKEGAWRLWKSNADSCDAAVYRALSELGVQPNAYDESFVDYENACLSGELPAESAHAVMKELLWDARNSLNLETVSSYAIALTEEPNMTDDAKLRIENILRLLAQYRAEDDENQTVWLDLGRFPNWCFWRWFGGVYEAQASYLSLLQRVDDSTLDKLGIKDDASRLVKYLLNNRKNATYWNSTRDTAMCVEAFAEYLKKTNELAPNATVEILIDGELKKTVAYTPDSIFETDGTLVLNADEIASGEHTATIRVNGDSPIYYNAYLEFFTLEDPIAKAGLELKTERRYYKLVERKDATATVEGARGNVVEYRVEKFDRVPLKSGDQVLSGDVIEVELLVDSKNDYESILLEDAKPAGFEALEQRSGYDGNALGAYVEYRDDRVCFFASTIPQGRSSVTYKLRAETPGAFSALPTKIWAMYAPELKGNADEFKTQINDK